MRVLVIDTATEACSVALFGDGELIAGACRRLGRGHAEQLVPMIAALPARGRAQHILVNCGPGSFTGLRVGLSAARALALAYDATVSGYSSMALVAAMAFEQHGDLRGVAVAMQGGHGEYFVQNYSKDGAAVSDLASLAPEAAIAAAVYPDIAGSAAETLIQLRGSGQPLPIWPDARAAFLLNDTARSLPAHAVYGRAPDAKPMAAAPPARGG